MREEKNIEELSNEELIHFRRGIARGDYPGPYRTSQEKKVLQEVADRLDRLIFLNEKEGRPEHLAPALRWSRWPDQKPKTAGKYIIARKNYYNGRALYIDIWTGSGWKFWNPDRIIAWAII